MDIVLARGLTKRYGRHTALRRVDLAVPRGTLFGFLGPNGAGKSTTIRILLGLLRASGGQVRVLEADPWRDGPRLRRRIGYLPGDVRLYGQLRGRELIELVARARRMRDGGSTRRLCDLFPVDLHRRIRDYSTGMKQQLGLILALMHDPELLVLDEPTNALDPLLRRALFDELRRRVTGGATVLFSSHTLPEVEELCTHVAIIRAGRIVEQAPISTLRQRALRRVELRFREAVDAALPDGLHVHEREPRRLVGAWTGPVEPLVQWLARQPVEDVTISPPRLEDLFLACYDASGAESPA